MNALQRRLCEQSAEAGEHALCDLVFHPAKNGVRDGFAGLEDDVAGEAIGDDHFDGILEKVVAFNVATESETARLEQLECFACEVVPLFVLRTDRHEADARILVAQDVARIDAAHDRVLQHLLRRGVGVCAGVDEDEKIRLGGHGRRDSRTLDPGERAELDLRSGDASPGMPGADHCGGGAVLYEIDCAADR